MIESPWIALAIGAGIAATCMTVLWTRGISVDFWFFVFFRAQAPADRGAGAAQPGEDYRRYQQETSVFVPLVPETRVTAPKRRISAATLTANTENE